MQFLVKRKGLDFTAYGLADATAIKRQKLGGGNAAPTDTGHLCRAVLDEYAAWDASFKRSLESHKDGSSAIDLGEATVLCRDSQSGTCSCRRALAARFAACWGVAAADAASAFVWSSVK